MDADGLVRVEDLESANGTFINGTQIHGLEIVRPGDRVGLGPVTFVVEYDLTLKTPRRLDGGDEDEIVETDDVELVKDASTLPKKASPPVEEAVEEMEEAEEKPSILGDQEEIRLPEQGDLRDFLTGLQ
jgi:pSer/pThr/pTyr-binding forkhead associated (FHA) protein